MELASVRALNADRLRMKERGMAKIEQARTDRRGFLRLAGFGAVAGGAALVASSDESEAAAAALPEDAAGYRETAHVKTFYDTARF